MRLTNKHGLPDAIYQAVANDDYDPGDADFTVTELLKPPRIRQLEHTYADEIEIDASERIWSLLGQAVHTILERAEDVALREKRFVGKFGRWNVSGKFDRYVVSDGLLQDYKIMSVWEIMGGLNEEKEQQINVMAEILRQNDYPINSLQIIPIYRDWSKRRSHFERDYPSKQVQMITIPIWSPDFVTKFVTERIHLHLNAAMHLPRCRPSEMWTQGEAWAVMKKGNKRAIKLHDAEWKAKKHIKAIYIKLGHGNPFYIQYRPGVSNRCEFYCNVAQFCEQFKEEKDADNSQNTDR